MTALNLRTRVAAAVAITCIAVVAALAITLYTASEDLEETLVGQIVSEEMEYLVRHHLENPRIIRESGPNLQYYVVHSPEDLARVPEALRGLAVGSHEVGQDIDGKHVAVREVGGTRFIVAYDAGPHEIREQQFKRLVLFALATIIVVAAALGYWIAGLITRQITDLAARVTNPESETGTNMAPLVRSGQDPEVAALAQALDRYRNRMQEMIRHEQEFTGNASHEMRTPLTAISTSCELLGAEPDLSEKVRTRITAISAAATRMTEQLELLLFLARLQALDKREPVPLAASVDTALEPWRAELTRKQLRFDNTIDPAATTSVNQQALNLVLTNLLRNAVQYTIRGSIRVTWEAPVLTLTDTGPGLTADAKAHLFERHYRGEADAHGLGLGLAIVKNTCSHCGWDITVSSPPQGGSAFHLTLA